MAFNHHSDNDFHFRRCRYMLVWYVLTIACCFSSFSHAADRLLRGQSLTDGQIITSARKTFALGFFNPQGSSNFRYLGIWYNDDPSNTTVWVANGGYPVFGTGGTLSFGSDGNLVLKDGNGSLIWSRNATAASDSSTAILMETGDLVVQNDRQAGSNTFIWESFRRPTDTFLPGMRIYFDTRYGAVGTFNSWKTESDPAPGHYFMGIDPRGAPQMVMWDGVAARRWRSGYWTGVFFTGIPVTRGVYKGNFIKGNDNGRGYFNYTPVKNNNSPLLKIRLNWNGIVVLEAWDGFFKRWNTVQSHPVDECDLYNNCDVYAICNQVMMPKCSCVKGFVPKNGGGCIRAAQLECTNGGNTSDGFVRVENVMKLPDLVDYIGSEDFKGCKQRCLQNCSCTAFAFVMGINCMIWAQDLVDILQAKNSTNALFIRVAHSAIHNSPPKRGSVPIVAVVATILVLSSIVVIFMLKTRRPKESTKRRRPGISHVRSQDIRSIPRSIEHLSVEEEETETGLQMYSLQNLKAATENFDAKNKLGSGGFGDVYKGMLPTGQEIAIKRLARISGRGFEEFKTEVTLIARLQHRNLVKLLGCCIDGDERMLLYEYMPNKSLDHYLFDPNKKILLDWKKRFNIIGGVARGLLYLHRDSRLRIIHRDLKAGNVLLDKDMNPKISDFGMARIFGGNQNEATTINVVGTYGYMAPEYAMEGLFSIKSDVYSFGILLLEIITGKKNTSFRTTDYSNIIGYVWEHWKEGRVVELIDPSISGWCLEEQVLGCIHIGLLCVQEMGSDRPNMQAVVLMLESENKEMPMPKGPALAVMGYGDLGSDVWDGRHLLRESQNDISFSPPREGR